jgi:hypothetical protein
MEDQVARGDLFGPLHTHDPSCRLG